MDVLHYQNMHAICSILNASFSKFGDKTANDRIYTGRAVATTPLPRPLMKKPDRSWDRAPGLDNSKVDQIYSKR